MGDSRELFKFEMNFYNILSEILDRKSIYLQIPETIIKGFGFESPTLFCTDWSTGELLKKSEISAESLIESFKYFEESEKDKNFPIAVIKIGITPDQDHCKVLFSAQECQEKWEENLNSNQAIQRYIRNGNTLSLIKSYWDSISPKCISKEIIKYKNVKTAYKAYKKSAMVYRNKSMIEGVQSKANRDLYQILESDTNLTQNSCNLLVLNRKMMYLVNIIEKYFLQNSNLKVLSLNAEWIENTFGEVFLINLKNYRLGEIEAVKSNITLFQIPKIELSEVPLEKPRSSINIRKKLKKSLSSSFSTIPKS